MKTTMDFIKKNWVTIAIVIVIVAVSIYFMKKKKKPVDSGGALNRTPVPDESKAGLQRKLSDCEKNTSGIRLIAGVPHPCDSVRDAVATSTESSYSKNNNDNIGDKINIVDYAIGDPGMAMLTESNYAIKLPGMDIRNNASMKRAHSQAPISNYTGDFASANGLNVVDFASGLEGTSLLLDKNMKAESNYDTRPRTVKPGLSIKF